MTTIDWLKVPPPDALLPRRPAYMPPMPKALTRDDLFDLIHQHRERIVTRFRDNELALERGRDRTHPDLDPAVDAAFENLRMPAPPPRLDASVEAVCAAMSDAHFGVPVVPYWTACSGLAFAVKAMGCWAPLSLEHGLEDEAPVAWLVQRMRPVVDETPLSHVYDDETPWAQLRRAVACADPATYEEALQAATKLREDAGPEVRCGLSFAFPSEPDWAQRDAFHEVQCVPKDPRKKVAGHLLMLLASLRDANLAERIVREAVAHDCADEARDYTWELVANLGQRAERVLEVLEATRAIKCVRGVVRRARDKWLEPSSRAP